MTDEAHYEDGKESLSSNTRRAQEMANKVNKARQDQDNHSKRANERNGKR